MVARVRPPTPISDEELVQISRDNPGWKVELVDGTIQMTPPNVFEGGVQNAELTALLLLWGKEHGYVATDSNAGYKLPNGSVLSPDGALVSRRRVDELTPKERLEFCRLIPEVVVELASKSDSRTALRAKCERWNRDGVRYVVLLDPEHGAESWGEAPPDFPSPDSLLHAVTRES